MTLNWAAIWAVARKDLLVVTRSKAVMIPMITVPLVLMVLWPAGLAVLMTMAPEPQISQPRALVAALPPEVLESMTGLDGRQRLLVLMLEYVLAPMFLIVPMMVSSILAADSVAGERERKTLEGLLYTPMTDSEIFVAKVLYSFAPACLVSVASFLVYAIVVNLAGYKVMGRLFFPTVAWWPLVFWLGPAVSVIGLGASVLISSKAKTFMQAQQTSGLLVLPIVFLMIGQITGLFFLSAWLTIIVGLFAWVIGLWLVWVGARTFARGELAARI